MRSNIRRGLGVAAAAAFGVVAFGAAASAAVVPSLPNAAGVVSSVGSLQDVSTTASGVVGSVTGQLPALPSAPGLSQLPVLSQLSAGHMHPLQGASFAPQLPAGLPPRVVPVGAGTGRLEPGVQTQQPRVKGGPSVLTTRMSYPPR